MVLRMMPAVDLWLPAFVYLCPHTASLTYTQTHKIHLKIKKNQKGKKRVSQKLTTQGDAKEEGKEVAINFHHQEAKAAQTTLLLKPFHTAFSDRASTAKPGPVQHAVGHQ